MAVLYLSRASTIPLIPHSFDSINEARETLDDITAHIYRLFKPIEQRSRTLPYKPLLPNLSALRTHVVRLLEDWTSAFNNSPQPHIDPKSITVKVLQIQHIAATIHISTLFYRDQLAFDAFTAEFSKIITLATAVIETIPRDDGISTFSFDIGIIQPLYFTACKCRHPVLRRRAIDILARSGMEGAWDGRAMAAAAKWVVKMEEGGTKNDEGSKIESDDDFVPEERRLREIAIGMFEWRQGKSLVLTSTTRSADGAFHVITGNVGRGLEDSVDDPKRMGRWEDMEMQKRRITEWRWYVDGEIPEDLYEGQLLRSMKQKSEDLSRMILK
jgi:hypothetical protein